MTDSSAASKRRVLIASSHALFGQGLRNLLEQRSQADVLVVGMVASLEEAQDALKALRPDLIILDYDDQALNREEFLARFVEGETKLRLVLLSLQSPDDAVVYDRRTLAASQIDTWLEEWNTTEFTQVENKVKEIELNEVPRRGVMKRAVKTIRKGMHLIIASVLVVVVAALLILALEQWGHNLLPVAAARQAEPIDALFDLEFKVIAFLFSLIIVLMGYSMIVFRRKRGDLEDASHVEGNQKLEIVWTVAPLATVLFFAYLGGQGLAETLRVDPYPVQVNVIGQKWSWSFEYPLSQRDAETLGVPAVVSDKLYLPVDKQAMLNLRSLDIIHSFWVPEFRVKQDALPGGREFIRTLRVNPSVTGTYALRCAELCGLQHTTMVADVVVMSQEEYDAWYKAEIARLSDPVAIGEAVYKAKCIACHSLDGTPGVGPTWQGIFGRTEQLTDGTSVTIDEGYILKSILDPNAQIVQGFAPGLMPQTYAQELSELQLSGIIEFMKTLR